MKRKTNEPIFQQTKTKENQKMKKRLEFILVDQCVLF